MIKQIDSNTIRISDKRLEFINAQAELIYSNLMYSILLLTKFISKTRIQVSDVFQTLKIMHFDTLRLLSEPQIIATSSIRMRMGGLMAGQGVHELLAKIIQIRLKSDSLTD